MVRNIRVRSLPPRATSWSEERGFTLLEIILVVTLMILVTMSLGKGFGVFARMREERYIKNLIQTIQFLHVEAETSQEFFQIEFDLKERYWHVGILRPDVEAPAAANTLPDVGTGSLSLELAEFLNPPLGNSQYFIPPPNFPSLAEPRVLPGTAYFENIETPRGQITVESGEKPYLIFSPRGFTEFAVIHLKRSNEQYVTLVTNPFTGKVDLHEGYKEFRWEIDEAAGL